MSIGVIAVSFAWPVALFALASAPLLIGAHLWALRRRRRSAVRFAGVAQLRAVLPATMRWRRHIPVGLLAGALVLLGFAAARPSASVTVPLSRTTVILALDTSRSMCATDVAPNRLSVAQDAAAAYVRDQPDGTQIGVVAFNGFAALLVPPTDDRDRLLDAIAGLTTARGTAIGLATLASIDALAAVNTDVAPTGVEVTPPADGRDAGYIPDVIVLLTDGRNSAGVEPLIAIEEAVARRVRVYTIGFGTTEASDSACTAEQLGGSEGDFGGGFGGGGGGLGGGGGGRFRDIDEPTLQAMAELSGGEYYKAQDAAQLNDVFASLPQHVVPQTEQRELSVWFALAGALLAAAATVLSLRWNRVI